jgi:hypothetical protein
MHVIILEKRDTFSRVNILTLWPQTADDLMSFGAKLYCPKFTNHGDLLHLGTREIQLVLFKSALLLGATVHAGTELVAVQAPSRSAALGGRCRWSAWARNPKFAQPEPPEEEEDDDEDDEAAAGGADDEPDLDGVETERADLASEMAALQGTAANAKVLLQKDKALSRSSSFGRRFPKKLSLPSVFSSTTSRQDSTHDSTRGDGKGGGKKRGKKLQVPGAFAAAEGAPSAAEPTGKGKKNPTSARSGKGGGSGGAPGKEAAPAASPKNKKVAIPAAFAGGGGGTSRGGGGGEAVPDALAFKPSKLGDYSRGALQGGNNLLAKSEVSKDFVFGADREPPADVRKLSFDALALAEGEWSPTCKMLGVTKTVDRFATAIGLIVNMVFDPSDREVKQLRSFIRILGGELIALKEIGIDCENLEFLKGETLYVAACVKKRSLLERGVLREDLPSSGLLSPGNVDLSLLTKLGRDLAGVLRIPSHTSFCDFHPVKLFDFSTRARCLTPFRVLGVSSSQMREPLCMDLEAVPVLTDCQLAWHKEETSKFQDELSQISISARTYETAIAANRADLKLAPDADARARLEAEVLVLRQGQEAVVEKLDAAKRRFGARDAFTKEFEANVRQFAGASSLAPVFPIGDSLLEPFWPQGLGSNRGFHSALDTAWAIQTMRQDGLQPALLERSFAYDVMMLAPMGFHRGIIHPGSSWSADLAARYLHDVIKSVMLTYTDQTAKRMRKGKDAIPPRYLKLSGKPLGTTGKPSADSRAIDCLSA